MPLLYTNPFIAKLYKKNAFIFLIWNCVTNGEENKTSEAVKAINVLIQNDILLKSFQGSSVRVKQISEYSCQ